MSSLLRSGAGAVLAAALALPVVLLPATSVAAEKTVRIVSGNQFDPASKFVEVGDTVRWTYNDTPGIDHTVTNKEGSSETFESSPDCPGSVLGGDDCLDQNGESFRYKFSNVGDFAYYCRIHGDSMSGTIHVRPKSSTGSSPSQTATRTTSPPSTSSTSASPSTPVSPSGSLSPSGSPSGSPSPTQSESLSPGDDNPSGSGGKVAIALGALAALGASGFLIYRRFIAGG